MIGSFDNDYQEVRYIAQGGYYDHSLKGVGTRGPKDKMHWREHPSIWKMWAQGMFGKPSSE